jgi:homotetrameric cytidine deaminase
MDNHTFELFIAAREAQKNAYAPYSRFNVGAALYIQEHTAIIAGCNVENVSYGATVCAERNAIASAIARYGTAAADHLLVISPSDPPVVPCALCLQVLREFCKPTLKIYLATPEGIQRTLTLQELLPIQFDDFTPQHH